MSVLRWRQTAVVAFALVGLSACKESTPPLLPSIFTNPGEVAVVCFDSETTQSLPLECCSNKHDVAGKKPVSQDETLCGTNTTPALHALVTQIQRGEVAAVDLVEKKVQDSNKSIPGYTFVDVGGLPTAIVVPPVQPGSAEGERRGPTWAYVAGRQNNSVRAIQTCRFLVKDGESGDAGVNTCKPIETDKPKPDDDERNLADERSLVSEPRDMVLAEDGQGLWISLPDRGLLAYVALGDSEAEPFAPGEVVYYPLPKDLELEPATPVSEQSPYGFFCDSRSEIDAPDAEDDSWDPVRERLKARYAPPDADAGVVAPSGPSLQMPRSTPAASTREARPTLLRMVDASPDGSGKLLFVVDEGQMALHVFAFDPAESALSLRASLPVGAPLRDFTVTPFVPARALTRAEMESRPSRVGAYPETSAQKRYLYAIDDRDGSLMAFELAIAAGVPSLTPLLAPQPARDDQHRSRNLADRLSLGIDGNSARALDVVDTRTRFTPDGFADDLYCGDGSRSQHARISPDAEKGNPQRGQELETLQAEIDERKKELAALLAKLAGHTQEELDKAQRAVDAAQERFDRVQNAGPRSLHGVFLMVATTTGQLAVLDVHDMDLPCRVPRQCDAENPPDDKLGVIVERHTARLTGTSVPTVSLSGSDELAATECPAGYGKVPDSESPLCVSGDPWLTRALSIAVSYEEAFIPGQANGVFALPTDAELAAFGLDAPAPKAADTVLLRAPAGVDLCARGVNAEDQLFAALASPPETKAGSGCTVASFTTAPHLPVIKAWHDALLLDVSAGVLEREGFPKGSSVESLLQCYPEFVTFDVGVRDQYLVRGARYQNNNMTAADGSCVVDGTLDTLFKARAQLDEVFQNQYVAFTLKAKESTAVAGTDAGVEADAGSEEELARALKKEVNPTMSVTINATVVSASVAGATSRTDTLPHRVRYFPETGYLFVVDQASQGLRSFELTPVLKADSSARYQ